MLINVQKHKVNCFHRSINLFMIDSCRNVTEHAFQSNYITPFRFKTIKIVSPYHTIKSISLCKQIFLVPFRSAKYQYPNRNGIAQNTACGKSIMCKYRTFAHSLNVENLIQHKPLNGNGYSVTQVKWKMSVILFLCALQFQIIDRRRILEYCLHKRGCRVIDCTYLLKLNIHKVNMIVSF